MAKKNSSTDLQKIEAEVPALIGMFEGDAGMGFEGTGMEDYAIPFIVILQKMSPQVDPDKPEYLPDAKVGDFFNTATKAIHRGDLLVIPVLYERKFAEWVPREQGGGFRGHHDAESREVAVAERDDRGRFITGRGTHLMDTRYHFVILLINGRAEQALIAMSSTQIKASRSWMTAMSNIRMQSAEGRFFTPPMFSHVYKITTATQQNEKGTWKGYQVEIVRPLNPDEMELYKLAKKFREQIAAGKVKVDESARERFTDESASLEEEAF